MVTALVWPSIPGLVWCLAITLVAVTVACRLVSRIALRYVLAAVIVVWAMALARHGGGSLVVGAQNLAGEVTKLALGDEIIVKGAWWGVVLAPLAWGYRAAEIVSAKRIPGPVDITVILGDDDPTDGGRPEREGLRALMRQRLAECNLQPAQVVPGGYQQKELVDIVQTNPLVELTGIASVLSVLTRAASPVTGYNVTATLRTEASTSAKTVTVDMSDARTQRSYGVETVEGRTYEEAVEKAACWVAWHVLKRCTTVYSWQRWWSAEALECYLAGKRADDANDWDRARTEFAAARVRSPKNLHAAVALPPLEELRERHDVAIAGYLHILRDYPRLVETRYRLAIVYYLVDSWGKDLLEDDQCERRDALRRAIHEHHLHLPENRRRGRPNPLDAEAQCLRLSTVKGGFYDLAQRELDEVKRSLTRGRVFRWKLRRGHPFFARNPLVLGPLSGPDDRWKRQAWQAVAATASLAVELKRAQLEATPEVVELQPSPAMSGTAMSGTAMSGTAMSGTAMSGTAMSGTARLRLVEEEVMQNLTGVCKRWHAGWHARYNAGCVVAKRISKPPEPGADLDTWQLENEELARAALGYIRRSYGDEKSDFPEDPIYIRLKDPDLDNLRQHRLFREWVREMRFEDTPRVPPSERERKQLVEAWYKLENCAHHLGDEWAERVTSWRKKADFSDEALDVLVDRECARWAALANLARRPEEPDRWDSFHRMSAEVAEHPASHGAPPMRRDFGDPVEVMRKHRRSWAYLSENADSIAQAWSGRREILVGLGPELLRETVLRWADEVGQLWLTVEQLSHTPLRTELHDDLRQGSQIR